MKKILPLLICLVLSVIVVSATSLLSGQIVNSETVNTKVENALIGQSVISAGDEAKDVSKLYHQGTLLGYITDIDKIKAVLDEEYVAKYAKDFPNSKIGLGEDLYITNELTYQTMENVDDKIVDYIKSNDLFSIETNKVDFSTSEGVYATIYVKNIDDFNNARNNFLKNFVSEDALNLFSQKKTTPEQNTYGRRELGVSILETISVTKATASPSKILTSQEEVFQYLCYGESKERTYYTVQEGDTVEGVGSLADGLLSASQVMTLNPDIIKSTEQILEPGTDLNVTYFTSPISVIVEKEYIVKEEVYPDSTIYFEDPNLREGMSRVTQEEVVGSQNAKYVEKWVNGYLISAEKISSAITKQPQQEIVYRGTKVIPGIGTGSFRWPVDNPSISCGWYCYGGHTAIDIQNRYNRYGNAYAADRGTVVRSGYASISGYYMVIDHGNGLQTQYNHFNKPPAYGVGVNVNKGDVIGQIGMSGKATGPHVHFVIMENWSRVNPCKYMGC